jgi:flagellar biosynthesis/type III secretory pathway protein FliH
MSLSAARVVSREQAARAIRVEAPISSLPTPRARVVPKPVVDAQQRAREILAAATAEAERTSKEARAALDVLYESTLAEARAAGAARLAAETLALADLQARADERALDRLVALSRLLAERLLGETLTIDPSRVVALAERALKEARGARRITIVAHPDDVEALESALLDGRREHVTRVVSDASRSRGQLRFETDIGVLDADIAPQLDRLAERLREALAHER